MSRHQEILDEMNRIVRSKEQAIARHEAAIEVAQGRLDRLVAERDYIEAGHDPSDWVVAQRLLQIAWVRKQNTTAERLWMVEIEQHLERAIEIIRHRDPLLDTKQIGVKSSETRRSSSFEVDRITGPTSGHVWFSITLQSRVKIDRVSEADRLALIRYLRAIITTPNLRREIP